VSDQSSKWSQPRPADSRPILRAAVLEVAQTGVRGRELVDALVERLVPVVDDLALHTFLTWMGDALAAMPEQEGKAKMFDILMLVNPRLPGMLDPGAPS